MSTTKTLNTRIQNKHATYSAWEAVATTFTPYDGEVVIYDAENGKPTRVKIGDGTTLIGSLPFLTSYYADSASTAGKLVTNDAGTYTDINVGSTGQPVYFSNGVPTVCTTIPTNISDLTNDIGYITDISGKADVDHTHSDLAKKGHTHDILSMSNLLKEGSTDDASLIGYGTNDIGTGADMTSLLYFVIES